MVPLLVLTALKPRARNPRGVDVDELFLDAARDGARLARGAHQAGPWAQLFLALDRVLRLGRAALPGGLRAGGRSARRSPSSPSGSTARTASAASSRPWSTRVMMYDCPGLSAARSRPRHRARRPSRSCSSSGRRDAYCQPCLSPVWDTALACHALLEAGDPARRDRRAARARWLKPRRCSSVVGDWAEQRPRVRPGGWAFQYANPHYPDLDDTAVVVMAMDRARHRCRRRRTTPRSTAPRSGSIGLQSAQRRLGRRSTPTTRITTSTTSPSPTTAPCSIRRRADVTARCLSMLAQLGNRRRSSAHDTGLAYLSASRRPTAAGSAAGGSTTSTGPGRCCRALNAVGLGTGRRRGAPRGRLADRQPARRRRLGRDGRSYAPTRATRRSALQHASQTAWALLGLMAAGEIDHPAVGAASPGCCDTSDRTAPGTRACTPRSASRGCSTCATTATARYFPLWALARYRRPDRRATRHRCRSASEPPRSRLSGARSAARSARLRARRARRRHRAPGGGFGASWSAPATARRTAALAEERGDGGAQCLISFGIAGGLWPGAAAGRLAHRRTDVVARRARAGGRTSRFLAAALADLARQIGPAEGAALAAQPILATQAEKRRAWREPAPSPSIWKARRRRRRRRRPGSRSLALRADRRSGRSSAPAGGARPASPQTARRPTRARRAAPAGSPP